MSRKYFGTDGVRGPYGGPVVNESFAARLGAAAAHWLRDELKLENRKVVIGRDFGNTMEITNGISTHDSVIVSPPAETSSSSAFTRAAISPNKNGPARR